MNGVTTAIVAYILFAQAFPSLIRNKNQYYAALCAVFIIILFDALAHVAPSGGFVAFCYFINAVMQLLALLMLILAGGGMSARDLAGEFGDVIEVIRRGETRKEVIVPLSEQAHRRSESSPVSHGLGDQPKVYTIDTSDTGGNATPPPPPKPPAQDHTGPLPLD